jgi:hypothetical protein
MSELASHALLLEVILGGRTRLREALVTAGEPSDDDRVNREWVELFTNPSRAEASANHHMQHLADLLPRVTQSLLDRSWLLTVFERKTLATSDHPAYVLPNEELTRMGMGTGIENATAIHVPPEIEHRLIRRLELRWQRANHPNRPPTNRPKPASGAHHTHPARRTTPTSAKKSRHQTKTAPATPVLTRRNGGGLPPESLLLGAPQRSTTRTEVDHRTYRKALRPGQTPDRRASTKKWS